MANRNDDFLSILGSAFSTIIGRACLFVFACVLGIVAAHATAEQRFVWPSEVLWEAFPLFLAGFLLSWWGPLVSVGLIAFSAVYLARDIHWAYGFTPLPLVWFVSHRILSIHF